MSKQEFIKKYRNEFGNIELSKAHIQNLKKQLIGLLRFQKLQEKLPGKSVPMPRVKELRAEIAAAEIDLLNQQQVLKRKIEADPTKPKLDALQQEIVLPDAPINKIIKKQANAPTAAAAVSTEKAGPSLVPQKSTSKFLQLHQRSIPDISEKKYNELVHIFDELASTSSSASALSAASEPFEINCQDETEYKFTSQVGINEPGLFNNCYLNAVFQMLFQMCEFRKALISYNGENLGPVAASVKEILTQYQEAYNLTPRYEVIKPNFDLIKTDVYRVDPNEDKSDDPATLLIGTTIPRFFEETSGIADNFIFNNPSDPLSPDNASVDPFFRFVFPLIYPPNADTNIQTLINIPLNRDKFTPVESTGSQKYIILQSNRLLGGSKNTDLIHANSEIEITIANNPIRFKLKGIILHLPSSNLAKPEDGHFIYVTYDEGSIANIYNNQVVITVDDPQQVLIEGLDDIPEDSQSLYTKLLEQNDDGTYGLQEDYQDQINQNGYIYLYEVITTVLEDISGDLVLTQQNLTGTGTGLRIGTRNPTLGSSISLSSISHSDLASEVDSEHSINTNTSAIFNDLIIPFASSSEEDALEDASESGYSASRSLGSQSLGSRSLRSLRSQALGSSSSGSQALGSSSSGSQALGSSGPVSSSSSGSQSSLGSSGPGSSGPGSSASSLVSTIPIPVPVAMPGALIVTPISKADFEIAINLIKKIFEIQTDKELKEKIIINYQNLISKIENYITSDPDFLIKIFKNAFLFYQSIPKNILGTIKNYNDINDDDKRNLQKYYNMFANDYKNLNFLNSNIILYPTMYNKSRKKHRQANLLCNKVSNLIKPIHLGRTIPSQIPNLTKRNVTKRVSKQEKIKADAAKAKADAEAKAQADIKAKINILSEKAKQILKQKETVFVSNKIKNLIAKLDATPLPKFKEIEKIQNEIASLEKILEKDAKEKTTKEKDAKDKKGGTTRKLIQIPVHKINKKNKKTRKH